MTTARSSTSAVVEIDSERGDDPIRAFDASVRPANPPKTPDRRADRQTCERLDPGT